MFGQVGEFVDRNGHADAFELGFELTQLVRLPLAFVGAGDGARAQQGNGQYE
jgi:hypothetical protein